MLLQQRSSFQYRTTTIQASKILIVKPSYSSSFKLRDFHRYQICLNILTKRLCLLCGFRNFHRRVQSRVFANYFRSWNSSLQRKKKNVTFLEIPERKKCFDPRIVEKHTGETAELNHVTRIMRGFSPCCRHIPRPLGVGTSSFVSRQPRASELPPQSRIDRPLSVPPSLISSSFSLSSIALGSSLYRGPGVNFIRPGAALTWPTRPL